MDATFLPVGIAIGMGSGIAIGVATGASGRISKDKLSDLIRKKGIQSSDRQGNRISTDRFLRMVTKDEGMTLD